MRFFDELGSNGWTGECYSAYRVVFGGYLIVHLAMLLPYGGELFSSAGMLPDAALSPIAGVFPSPLAHFDSPVAITAFLWLGSFAGIAFAFGVRDRWASIGLWFVLTCLFNRNPLIANPSLPFVGWLLLAHALLPRAPRGSWDALRDPDRARCWRMPNAIFGSAWIVMSVGYTYSGWTKLVSPSWLDGSALARILQGPLARPTPLRDWLLALPEPALQLATWLGLMLEVGFAVLALSSRLRPFAWLALLGMHGMLIMIIDFADLSFGMVVLHLFTFNPDWIRTWNVRQISSDVYSAAIRSFSAPPVLSALSALPALPAAEIRDGE